MKGLHLILCEVSMSTRSFIGKTEEDGRIRYIYCHMDGDVDGVGRLLHEHYRDADAVDRLLDLGAIRILGCDAVDTTTAFHRDWGRKMDSAKAVDNREEYLEAMDKSWTEFAYLLDGGAWLVAHTKTGGLMYKEPDRLYTGCFTDLAFVLQG